MQNNIRIFCLLQRAPKGLYQMMGQLPDKANRIRQQNLLAAVQFQIPGCRIQSGEQLVLFQDIRPCELIQQSGFSRIGITHDSGNRNRIPAALLSCDFPMAFHGLQFLF